MRPRVRSYGDTSTVTRSPANTRMRLRRMFPANVVSTSWPLCTVTRNVALGSNSVTVPSSSIASCLLMNSCTLTFVAVWPARESCGHCSNVSLGAWRGRAIGRADAAASGTTAPKAGTPFRVSVGHCVSKLLTEAP